MNATLMDEVRTKRGLAYGAYMSFQGRQGPGALRGWVHTAQEPHRHHAEAGAAPVQAAAQAGHPRRSPAFIQGFLVGALASEMDDPARRLEARVSAELHGLPADEVDTLPDRLKAVTPAQVTGRHQASTWTPTTWPSPWWPPRPRWCRCC